MTFSTVMTQVLRFYMINHITLLNCHSRTISTAEGYVMTVVTNTHSSDIVSLVYVVYFS